MVDSDLRGAVAFVGGSSNGLGRAIALELAGRGATVAVTGRDRERIDAVVAKAHDLGGAAVGLRVDLTSAQETEQAVRRVVSECGGIDILVTNGGGPASGTFADLDDAGWQQGFEATLLSAVRMIRAALPSMQGRPWGRIVSIVSSSIREPIDGLLLSNVFRPGIVALVKSLSLELTGGRILVNAVAPGRFDTDRVRSLDEMRAAKAGSTPQDVRRELESRLPVGRYGRPEELAKVVGFLASPQNSYLTGQTLLVDGGLVRAL